MAEGPVALAAIGLTTAVLGIVVKPLLKLLSANTNAQVDVAKAIQGLTEETRRGNQEAADRNGHLGEQNVQIIELIARHNADAQHLGASVIEAVQNVHEQHVDTQIVEHSEGGDAINTKGASK